MAEKIQNLKPDVVLKNYWNNNERFANFFNGVLFGGKQIIRPEELEELDSEVSSVLENKKYLETMKESRDHLKIRKKSSAYGVELVMLGLESQQHIHYAMPMRVMGYDYGYIRKQYKELAENYRKREDGRSDEFLSKMKKTDRLMPVITIVVYSREQ